MKEINANILEGKYEDILAAVEKGVISERDKDNLLSIKSYNYSEPEIIQSMMK